MSVALSRSISAIAPGLTSSFLATGGTPPYVYSIATTNPVGPGGTVDSSTGIYTAPPLATNPPKSGLDTVLVTDSLGATATNTVLVGTYLQLFCDIIQTGMGLSDGRVFIWNQKAFEPTDSGLFVVISVSRVKPFGQTKNYDFTGTGISIQNLNVMATLDVNIISRGPAARDQKELVLMTLFNDYAERQMDANSFSIGRIPFGETFSDLSGIDGAAIPYRYMIPINITYCIASVLPVPYYSTFQTSVVQREN